MNNTSHTNPKNFPLHREGNPKILGRQGEFQNMNFEYYKKPTFDFGDYVRNSELSKGARRLLIHLEQHSKDEKYNLIKGFMPLSYEELSEDLDYSINEIKGYFIELELHNVVSRCIARFVCLNREEA